MAKVLLVEDDPQVASSVEEWLVLERHEVDCVADGKEGLDRLKFYEYDLAVLDYGLPGLSGVNVCLEYRRQGGKIPIIMLTGRGMIEDKEAGLNAGADDYLTKPFDLRELSARIRALLRRPAGLSGPQDVLQVGDLLLDIKSAKVKRQDEEIALVPRELALLEFLMRRPDQYFTQEVLLNRVWSSESMASPEALRQCVKRLRKKIDRPGEESLIANIHGLGYKLRAPADATGLSEE